MTFSSASSTWNSMNARRKATPEGNLCPTLLVTLTRALSAASSILTWSTRIVAVRCFAWSSNGGFGVGRRVNPDVAQHGVARAQPQDVGKLPRHLHQKDVQPDERMLAHAASHREVDLGGWQSLFGLRKVAEFLNRRDLAAIRRTVRTLARHVAVLTGLRARAASQRQRAIGRRAGAVIAEGPFRVGGLFVGVADGLAVVQDRQMHSVAGAADLGRRDVRRVGRIAADCRAHRNLLGLLERSIELVGRTDEEAAGERLGKAGEAGIECLLALQHAGILRLVRVPGSGVLAEDHAVACGARYAVARQRPVIGEPADRVVRRIGCGIDRRARKAAAVVAFCPAVDGRLALAQDAVAAEAGIFNLLGG